MGLCSYCHRDVGFFESDGKTGLCFSCHNIFVRAADLFFAFVNRPEFMATVLTILAFLMFSGKLQSPSDVWEPLVATVLFNAVWFVVSGIRKRMASGPKKEDSYTT